MNTPPHMNQCPGPHQILFFPVEDTEDDDGSEYDEGDDFEEINNNKNLPFDDNAALCKSSDFDSSDDELDCYSDSDGDDYTPFSFR